MTENTNQPAASLAARTLNPAARAVAAPGQPAPGEHERVQQLASELRCLVCQNQTIADSNSGLAIDLRNQIAEQMRAGKSDAAIKQYMVERYGEFVLYNPPFNAGNAALWLGPFILLVIGIWVAIRVARKNAKAAASDANAGNDAPVTLDEARVREIEERYRREI